MSRKQTRKKVVRIIDLSADGLTDFGKPVPKAVLKRLGPAKFTRQQQEANPHKPMTRVVKDCLRTGKWCVGVRDDKPQFWNVKPETLKKLDTTFQLHKERNIPHNMCWGHGDSETKEVDERDSIADLDNVVHHDNVLYSSAYVTPKMARDLQSRNRPVSVRVMDNWRDGSGKLYDQALLHVAVVDHAVVSGQGPFMELSNDCYKGTHMATKAKKRPKPKRDLYGNYFDLALHGDDEEEEETDEGDIDNLIDDAEDDEEALLEGDETDDEGAFDGDGAEPAANPLEEAIEASPPGTTVVPLIEHVAILNRLLPPGIDIPTEGEGATTEQSFNRDLAMVMTIAESSGQIPSEEEKLAEDGQEDLQDEGIIGDEDPQLAPDALTGEAGGEELPLELSNNPIVQAMQTLMQPMAQGMRQLSNRLNTVEGRNGLDKKGQYGTKLKELAKAGSITAADVPPLLNLGKAHGYDLSLLSSYAGSKKVDMSNQTRRIRTGKAPKVRDLGQELTDDRVEELANLIS